MQNIELSSSKYLLSSKVEQSSLLGEFFQSAVHSGLERPMRGIAQIVDQLAGSKTDETVQAAFSKVGAAEPQHAEFGSTHWVAQQLGNAVGVMGQFVLLRQAARNYSNGLIDNFAGRGLISEASTSALSKIAANELFLSGVSGAIYGSLLSPNSKAVHSPGEFIYERFKNGAADAATFAALGYTNQLMQKSFGSISGALEKSALAPALKAPVAAALDAPIIPGILSGVPAGMISSELTALKDGRLLPTKVELKENIASMALLGGTFGTISWLNSQNRVLPATNARVLTDKLGWTTPASTQTADFRIVLGQENLIDFQRAIANGESEVSTNVLARQRINTVSGAVFGEEFSTLGDVKNVFLSHSDNPNKVMSAAAAGAADIIATCSKLDSPFQNRDVFPQRAGASASEQTVWISPFNSAQGEGFTLSRNRPVENTLMPDANSIKPVSLGWESFSENPDVMRFENNRGGMPGDPPQSGYMAALLKLTGRSEALVDKALLNSTARSAEAMGYIAKGAGAKVQSWQDFETAARDFSPKRITSYDYAIKDSILKGWMAIDSDVRRGDPWGMGDPLEKYL